MFPQDWSSATAGDTLDTNADYIRDQAPSVLSSASVGFCRRRCGARPSGPGCRVQPWNERAHSFSTCQAPAPLSPFAQMRHIWELAPIPSVNLGSGCCLYPAPGLWQGVHQFFSPLSPSLPHSLVCTHHGECSLKLSSSPKHCGPETPAGGSTSASHPGLRCLVL